MYILKELLDAGKHIGHLLEADRRQVLIVVLILVGVRVGVDQGDIRGCHLLEIDNLLVQPREGCYTLTRCHQQDDEAELYRGGVFEVTLVSAGTALILMVP